MYVTGVAPQYAHALPSKLHSLPQRSHRSPLTSLILKLNDAQFCLAGGSNLSHDTVFVESFGEHLPPGVEKKSNTASAAPFVAPESGAPVDTLDASEVITTVAIIVVTTVIAVTATRAGVHRPPAVVRPAAERLVIVTSARLTTPSSRRFARSRARSLASLRPSSRAARSRVRSRRTVRWTATGGASSFKTPLVGRANMPTSLNLRARTRNAEPRHTREEDLASVERARASALASGSAREDPNAERKRRLGQALRRLDATLLGAPWCDKCKQQKELLAELLPGRWRAHYVDCGSASRCLTCTKCKTTPTWRVNGRRYPGVFDLSSLTELVGLQAEGSQESVEETVLDAVDAGDPLGGLKLGQLPVRGRNRRHRRRAGWAKRAAIRLAARERGQFWCEFGELLTPRVASRARAAAAAGEALAPL